MGDRDRYLPAATDVDWCRGQSGLCLNSGAIFSAGLSNFVHVELVETGAELAGPGYLETYRV